MRFKKDILKVLSCAVTMAVMAAVLMTGCGEGGEAPASPAESNSTAGSSASSASDSSSSSSDSSSNSAGSSSSSSSTNTANKATKLLLYTTGNVDADYVTDMDGYATHYRCAVSGNDVYSVNYQDSGEAYITVLKKGDNYYVIDGNYATKTTNSVIKNYLNSAKTGCNFPTSAEIATMTTGTYEVNGKEYYAEIQKKNVYGNQVRYIYCFEGNVLKYRVVEGLYYTTDKRPVKETITYNSISTKVSENLFDLSNYSVLEN